MRGRTGELRIAIVVRPGNCHTPAEYVLNGVVLLTSRLDIVTANPWRGYSTCGGLGCMSK